jgi:hypothetical protein
MLVKCHEHLYPLVRLDRNSTNQDIFEQTASTSELVEKLVKRELLVSRDINWMLKTSNFLFSGG